MSYCFHKWTNKNMIIYLKIQFVPENTVILQINNLEPEIILAKKIKSPV